MYFSPHNPGTQLLVGFTAACVAFCRSWNQIWVLAVVRRVTDGVGRRAVAVGGGVRWWSCGYWWLWCFADGGRCYVELVIGHWWRWRFAGGGKCYIEPVIGQLGLGLVLGSWIGPCLDVY